MKPIWLLLLALASTGCTSGGGDKGVFDMRAATPAPSVSSPPHSAETKIGSGSVRIAALLPFSATGAVAERARDVRDGATLAVEHLGKDVLTVTLEDSSAGAKSAALKAMGEGAAAIIGPFEAPAAADVATIRGGKLSPIFLLADGVPGAASIYDVALQNGVSAAAGARALAKVGARNFVLLSPEGFGAAATEKAVDFAAADHGGRIVAKARYSQDRASVLKAVDTIFAVTSSPDAVIIAGGAFDPAMIVEAVRAKGGARIKIAGNNSWRSSDLSNPLFNGVLIADLDEAELSTVASTFRARFGRELTPLAAYAYDVVALSSGIARALGRDGFARVIVEDSKGFRGATGTFRFRGDGSCGRLLALYRIDKGRLKKIQPPPAIF